MEEMGREKKKKGKMVTEGFLLGRVTLHQNLLPGQRLSLS